MTRSHHAASEARARPVAGVPVPPDLAARAKAANISLRAARMRWQRHGTLDILGRALPGGGHAALPATPAQMQQRRDELFAVIQAEPEKPMSVRRAFYRATVAHVQGIDKTEAGYQKVSKLLTAMRRDDSTVLAERVADALHEWITDYTREIKVPGTWSSIADFFETVRHAYRKAIWDRLDYVEIWAEKDVGFTELTDKYAVPLIVTHGQISEGFLYDSAQRLKAIESHRKIFLYHIGDHDPTADSIMGNIDDHLRNRLCPELGKRLHYMKLALTREQIEAWDIQLRPTKQRGTKLADEFEEEHGEGSAELDAIEPSRLRALVKRAINRHMPEAEYQRLMRAEERDRAKIRRKLRSAP